MIVSHRHDLIFLKARKVAGTSFEIALSKYLESGDIITPVLPEDELLRAELGGRGAQNYKFSWFELMRNRDRRRLVGAVRARELPNKYFNHIPAAAVRRRIGEPAWSRYLKVSIVRNPWDTVVSWFYWAEGRQADIDDLTRWSLANEKVFKLNRGMYLIDDRPVVDLPLRYEHLEEDISALESRRPALAGLASSFSGIRAKGGIRPAKSRDLSAIYAAHPKVNAMVEKFFDYEISRFGYRLEHQPPGTP